MLISYTYIHLYDTISVLLLLFRLYVSIVYWMDYFITNNTRYVLIFVMVTSETDWT